MEAGMSSVVDRVSRRARSWFVGAPLALALLAAAPALAAGPNYTHVLVHDFTGITGSRVEGGLVKGLDGHLYGMAMEGGKRTGGYTRSGTIYRVVHRRPGVRMVEFPDYTTIGAYPLHELVPMPDGDLYGVTAAGGAFGLGTAFRLSSAGGAAPIFNFDESEGWFSWRSITAGPDGHFYGITDTAGQHGWGFAFRLSIDGSLTKIHDFDVLVDGYDARRLTLAPDGHFYATSNEGPYEGGVLFRMSTSGAVTVLRTFTWCPDPGCEPNVPTGALAVNAQGELFGAAKYGGTTSNHGQVYKRAQDGTITVLHSFSGTDGRRPSSLTLAADGRLYGTTAEGRPITVYGGAGVVFSLEQDGTDFRVLHAFEDSTGYQPVARLLVLDDGWIYGTTSKGGSADQGTVFALKPSR